MNNGLIIMVINVIDNEQEIMSMGWEVECKTANNLLFNSNFYIVSSNHSFSINIILKY